MPDFSEICHRNRYTAPTQGVIAVETMHNETQPELSARITPDEFLVCKSVIIIGKIQGNLITSIGFYIHFTSI
jgi:hypothetical protein